MVYPLKAFPAFNFVPQPRTLSRAQAEIWYRQSAALLDRCATDIAEPAARVRVLLDLKHRMRDVAAQAMVATELRREFIDRHPLPTFEALIPDAHLLCAADLSHAAAQALAALRSPGERSYSELAGGSETFGVWSPSGYWEFDGNEWAVRADPPAPQS